MGTEDNEWLVVGVEHRGPVGSGDLGGDSAVVHSSQLRTAQHKELALL